MPKMWHGLGAGRHNSAPESPLCANQRTRQTGEYGRPWAVDFHLTKARSATSAADLAHTSWMASGSAPSATNHAVHAALNSAPMIYGRMRRPRPKPTGENARVIVRSKAAWAAM